jgi:hypothetical protein
MQGSPIVQSSEQNRANLAELRKQQAYFRRRVAALKNPARSNAYGARVILQQEAQARLAVAFGILTYINEAVIYCEQAQRQKEGSTLGEGRVQVCNEGPTHLRSVGASCPGLHRQA